MLPYKKIQTMIRLVDTTDRYSTEIYQKKKEALLKGDDEVKEQVGKGKDIMSILRKSLPILLAVDIHP